MKPHKHAEVIKAWADGHKIQYRNEITNPCWTDMPTCSPNWHENVEYRVKPKTDHVRYFNPEFNAWGMFRYVENDQVHTPSHLKLTFDGETGKLKYAEVL